ncbi:hypothetical protein AB4472_09250 [Vibrio lentus]
MKAIPLTAVTLALAGCASEPQPIVPEPMPPMNVRTAPALQNTPMVQTSRYTLTNPAHGARLVDILNVSVEARIPSIGSALSVEDGLSFLLSESGVHLREPLSYGEAQLYKQPLPLAHTDLGIMPLREALQVLGGEAFALQEDVVKREVGFTLKDGYVWQPPKYDETLRSESMKKGRSSGQVAKHTASPSQSSTDDMQDQNDALFAGSVNTAIPSTSKAKSAPSKSSVKKKSLTTYRVHAGESFRTALTRWAYKHGDQPLAFAQDKAFLTALDEAATQDFIRTGSLYGAVKALSASNPSLSTLTLYSKTSPKLLAFHPWQGERVTTLMVSGDTLKTATKQVARHYGWRWDEKSSWPVDNFTFTPYPLVTIDGDISMAMTTLLGPYPLKAQRLDATKTIYIKEVTPL